MHNQLNDAILKDVKTWNTYCLRDPGQAPTPTTPTKISIKRQTPSGVTATYYSSNAPTIVTTLLLQWINQTTTPLLLRTNQPTTLLPLCTYVDITIVHQPSIPRIIRLLLTTGIPCLRQVATGRGTSPILRQMTLPGSPPTATAAALQLSVTTTYATPAKLSLPIAFLILCFQFVWWKGLGFSL